MKKKIKIKNEFLIPNEILAISSQYNDYQLAWEINNNFEIDLTRTVTDFIENKKDSDNIDIVLYSYEDSTGYYYYLLKNKYEGISILPKLNNIDYVLVIEDERIDLSSISSRISSSRAIVGSFRIKLNQSQVNYLKKILLK